jgi:ParB family transcriptional regulator, chromosome partitioning protein
MNKITNMTQTIEVEWHQLELRYQSLRIHTASAVRHLMLSIHSYGLLAPITVTASGVSDRPWVVVDGYLRILALKALGGDLITATVWQIDVAEALLDVYKYNKSRTWEAFEEANLLQELVTSHQYSQAKLAQLLGKSEAWICHRLQLTTQLPCFVKDAICQGFLSSWAASRILIPFARANAQHAEEFVSYLSSKSHTSREIQSFYEQYLRSNKKIRSELAANPSIFFKLQELNKLESSCRYTELPPEHTWDRKCEQILDCLRVLDSIMPAVFYPQQTAQEQQGLQDKFHQARAKMDDLHRILEGIIHA